MRAWSLVTEPVDPRKPRILQSDLGEGRAVFLTLLAGQELPDHQVQERAYVVVAAGRVELRAGAKATVAAAGTLAVFEPRERHEVRAIEDARLLIMLAPWPSPTHRGLTRDRGAC